jgi:hypothetical protein
MRQIFVNIKGLCPAAADWNALKTCLATQANAAQLRDDGFFFQARTTSLNVLNLFYKVGFDGPFKVPRAHVPCCIKGVFTTRVFRSSSATSDGKTASFSGSRRGTHTQHPAPPP